MYAGVPPPRSYLCVRVVSLSLDEAARSTLATVWALAYAEELLWDRMVWHDRPWLFGDAPDRSWLAPILVPLLAVPQLSHYVLDGFLWRRRSNPRLVALLRR